MAAPKMDSTSSTAAHIVKEVRIAEQLPLSSHFERLWALKGDQQRRAVSKVFKLDDEPVRHGPISIKLDHAVEHLRFAGSAGFNPCQTSAFFDLMDRLTSKLNDGLSVEEFFDFFRTAVVQMSIVNPAYRDRPPPPAPSKTTTVQPVPPIVLFAVDDPSKNPESGRRGKSPAPPETKPPVSGRGKPGKGEKVDPKAPKLVSVEPVPAEEKKVEPVVTVKPVPVEPPSQLFTHDNIKQITQYLSEGLLAHYKLYQTVYGDESGFEQVVKKRMFPYHLQRIIPDEQSLQSSVDLDIHEVLMAEKQLQTEKKKAEYERKKHEAKTLQEEKEAEAKRMADEKEAERKRLAPPDTTPEIGLAVKLSTAAAYREMERQLADNAAKLEKKFTNLQVNLGLQPKTPPAAERPSSGRKSARGPGK